MVEKKEKDRDEMVDFSQNDIDAIGEIANISFGSASTVLSTILNQPVNITIPDIEVVNLYDASDVELPHVVLEVGYEKAIDVRNVLVLKQEGARVIADLMMMGTGEVGPEKELTELELSAVKEAMNQMMGNAATAMSQLFNDVVEISPPKIKIVTLKEELENLTKGNQDLIKISFNMQVGDFLHSKVAQIISIKDAKEMVDKLLAPQSAEIIEDQPVEPQLGDVKEEQSVTPKPTAITEHQSVEPLLQATMKAIEDEVLKGVEVNLELIFGGKSIALKEFLSYEKHAIIEMVEDIDEPVKMMVNGVLIGYGELVNVNGHFGVRVLEAVTE